MVRVNENYLKIQASYLFTEIAHRVKAHQEAHPEAKVIRLGIGDVTEPLAPAVVAALHRAVDDEAARETFHGYGPEQGYAFLREAVAKNDFQDHGLDVAADEIFISDGAKCDCGNIQELFSADVKIAVTDPVYPVYVDTNVMAGRTGASSAGRYSGLVYLSCSAANGFVPSPADLPEPVDVVYLCYPNNPTGATATKEQLQAWVDWANANKALILFDAAYEAFIRTPGSTSAPARAPARSSSAAIRKRPASPASAAATRSCRRDSSRGRPTARRWSCARSGRAARRRSSTAAATSPSAAPRRSTPPRAPPRRRPLSTSTSKTPS